MKTSHAHLRRLILGMSIEDAQSKFDSPESRSMVRVAHERHNQGVLHELHIAQHARNGLAPEKKCHISRYSKPSVRGFQGYTKRYPEDYVIIEQWGDGNRQQTQQQGEEKDEDADDASGESGKKKKKVSNNNTNTSHHQVVAVKEKISQERLQFASMKTLMLSTLANALDVVKENVLSELTERRQSGSLVAGQQQASVVDRLVGEVKEAKGKGYKSLSSSTHLLEPVEMTLALHSKKEKDVAEAFKCPMLALPAREGDISYSLWVSGGLIADETLVAEFPYHIAKYVVNEDAMQGSGGGSGSGNRLPRADVQIYFSPELYQANRTIGKEGIAMIRQFIGKVMMRQHEPTAVSTSLILNATDEEKVLYNLYHAETESIRIPWISKTRSKVSTVTGVTFSIDDATADNASVEQKKEAMALIWRAWGHLIKDLHVYGDADFMHVMINRQKEAQENDEHINEVKLLEETAEQRKNEIDNGDDTNNSAAVAVLNSSDKKSSVAARNASRKGSYQQRAQKKKQYYIPVSADFTVVECLLERKGLPHNLVMEDIAESLTLLQKQAMDMLRLSVVEEAESLPAASAAAAHGGDTVVPVLYAPKISVSHAGVIENRSHSYQRIRIRGSSLLHIQALADALSTGEHFTNRTQVSSYGLQMIPSNLSFSNTSYEHHGNDHNNNRQLGHRADVTGRSSSSGGRFQRHQQSQAHEYLIVSDEERSFWRENYYKISGMKIIFHDRVEAGDALNPVGSSLSPRLNEHLQTVARLSADENDEEDDNTQSVDSNSKSSSSAARTKAGKARNNNNKRRKQKKVDISTIRPERMFEYLCTDMEAESAEYDLVVGQCEGYEYRIRVGNIPTREAVNVTPACTSVSTKGFINYFGPNRFASYTKMNIHPGLHLLKGEFRAAAHCIVQQFYMDAAMEAEKQRTGAAFPKLGSLKGSSHYNLPDFTRSNSQHTVAHRGTAIQKVLSNAIQASLMLSGEDNARKWMSAAAAADGGDGSLDPCADAFLNVLGPNACRIIVNEYLSFVWNDIVNQRLQRYGTFSILPGDLVRKNPHAPRHSAAFSELALVTKADVQRGKYTCFDVVLPIPGAHVQLPDNYTSDLYVVTLNRWGLPFNPELRQWECFYPRVLDDAGAAPSPYRGLTASFALHEEELGYHTPFTTDYVHVDKSSNAGAGGVANAAVTDLSGVRGDLERQRGNALNLCIEAAYRTPLHRPDPADMQWRLHRGAGWDPYQRWGLSVQRSFPTPSNSSSTSLSLGTSTSTASLLVLPSFANSTSNYDNNSHKNNSVTALRHKRGFRHRWKRLPIPPEPYWLSENSEASLQLHLNLPTGVYASMLLRELTKMDVNSPDVVDIDRPLVDTRAKSFHELRAEEQNVYRKHLLKRRQRSFFLERPKAISVALLHQHIFRSGGVRGSLIPTLRSYDSVTK